MREHPDLETLKEFIKGQLTSEDARTTDRHLAVCSECRDRADEISRRLALRLLDSWLRPGYDEAFERAVDGATVRLEGILEEGRRTEKLLADLLQEPPAKRRQRIAREERFHSLKLSQLLLSHSREAWFHDPAVAVDMADLAVEVSLHLETGRYGSNLVEDSRALAWGHLGNALRIKSDLWRAEQAIR
ncbi:MAG TPA: hypothetical protein VG477_10845, partial [Thermoanaerobaculia bacterium]|nr:hypothetical protein [Thermoanaerobaculia bacterium]